MNHVGQKETRCHGLWVLNSRHREVRRLRRRHAPSIFGNRIWTASWLLVDYLSRRGLPQGLRIMEIACGWGLAGIYCAKRYQAQVIGVDADSEVYPFMKLHCRINGVETRFLNECLEDLTWKDFREVDAVIGADVCFWHRLVDPVKRLVTLALAAEVRLIVLADPGRPTFNEVGDYCQERHCGRQFYWRTDLPYRNHGQIIETGEWATGQSLPEPGDNLGLRPDL